MLKLALISTHDMQLRRIVAIQLASALTGRGYCCLTSSLGDRDEFGSLCEIGGGHDLPVASSPLGFDVLLSDRENLVPAVDEISPAYHYFVLDGECAREQLALVVRIADRLLLCTDLQTGELNRAKRVDRRIRWLTGNRQALHLIIPCENSPADWPRHGQEILDLADYFGYERIGEPVPGLSATARSANNPGAYAPLVGRVLNL